MYPTENEMQSRLLGFYKRAFPSRQSTRISDLTRISDGWENEVYSFTIEYQEAAERKHEDLILRIYPGADAPQKSAREFNAMKQLYEVSFPVPNVSLLELDSSPFGKPAKVIRHLRVSQRRGRQTGHAPRCGRADEAECRPHKKRICASSR
ncbi:MAG: phosphotransferase [Candidatus Bipolaricaulia bacterium]